MPSCIETFTGKHFDPLAPVFADIEIRDIAHSLSMQCRFTGHCRHFYSVAEHSVRVSRVVALGGHSNTAVLWGLLHDASEAYLVDLPSPLKGSKPLGSLYKTIERELMAAVCKRFGLPLSEPGCVRAADGVLLATEARDLMHGDDPYWSKLQHRPLPETIEPWAPDVAERTFLKLYRCLTGDQRMSNK